MKRLIILCAISAMCCITAAERRVEVEHTKDLKNVAFYPPGMNRGYFLPGQAPKFLLAVRNQTTDSVDVECRVAVKDYSGKIVFNVPDICGKIAPNDKNVFTFTIPPPKTYGYFLLDAELFANGKKALSTQSGFSVVAPIEKRDPFFGIGCFGAYPEMLDGYKLLGAGSIGLTLHRPWMGKAADIDKEIKSTRWQAFLKSDFVLVAHVFPVIRETQQARERVAQGLSAMSDEEMEHFKMYVDRWASLTKDRIRLWLLQLEYDAQFRHPNATHGTAIGAFSNTALMIRAGYKQIKKNNPDANVAVGGIQGIDYYNTEPRFKLTKILLDDLGSDFDLLCIDGYNGNWNSIVAPLPLPESNFRNFLVDTAKLAGSYQRPAIVINAEHGYAYDYFIPLDSAISRQITDFTARRLIINKSTPCPYSSWHKASSYGAIYGINTKKIDPAKPVLEMSICWKTINDEGEKGQYAFVPLPAGTAFAVVARELAFAKPSEELIIGSSVYCYTFSKPDGSAVMAFWSVDDPVRLFIDLPAKSKAVDMMGNPLPVKMGRTEFKLTTSPIYVSAAAAPETLAELFRKAKIQNEIPVVGGGYRIDAENALIFIRNTENRVQTVTIKSVDGNKIPVTLEPLKTTSVKIAVGKNLSGSQKFTLVTSDGNRLECPLNCETISVKPLTGKTALDGQWFRQLPGGKLVVPDNIFPKSSLIPEMGLLKLDGTDISAEYYSGYDKDNLYLAVQVKDKCHLQRNTGSRIWHEDSLQLAISNQKQAPAHVRGKNENWVPEFNYGFALTDKGGYFHAWSNGPNSTVEKIRHKVTRSAETGTTLYEIAVPWKTLDIVPEKGTGVRLGFVIFDNNRKEDRITKYWLALCEGVAGGQDPALFKTFILE